MSYSYWNPDGATQYRERNRERIRKYNREYYQRNRERILEQARSYYGHNRESIIERQYNYGRRHREQKREYDREYFQQNRDRITHRMCQYSYGYQQRNSDYLKRRRARNYLSRKKIPTPRKYARWTLAEDVIVMRDDITVLEICYMLGRSYAAISSRRKQLRKTQSGVNE